MDPVSGQGEMSFYESLLKQGTCKGFMERFKLFGCGDGVCEEKLLRELMDNVLPDPR